MKVPHAKIALRRAADRESSCLRVTARLFIVFILRASAWPFAREKLGFAVPVPTSHLTNPQGRQ